MREREREGGRGRKGEREVDGRSKESRYKTYNLDIKTTSYILAFPILALALT